jgi:hypothetical protein
MTPFVWSVMGQDAAQPLTEIIIRKEAERKSGGSFWWGIGTPLGDRVESVAILNGRTLPAWFSALDAKQAQQVSGQTVRVWKGWRSIRTGQRGIIPKHVLVLSDVKKNKKGHDLPYYALVCESDAELRLGNHGPFDPDQCLTVANGIPPGGSQRAALLTTKGKHLHGPYQISFKANLIGPWFVRLTDHRALTASELAKVRQYKPGDDWLRLCESIRPSPMNIARTDSAREGQTTTAGL